MQSANPPTSRPSRSRSRERRMRSRQEIKVSKLLYLRAIKDAFLKFNPQHLSKNPILFIVGIGTIVALVFTIEPNLFGKQSTGNPRIFNGSVTIALFLILWFSNFAEALAESRGKALASILRSAKTKTIAKKLFPDGSITEVSSEELQRGDTIYVIAGDIIPADGEVTMGVASVDESIVTGESAPVLKESGSDVGSSVTGGTRVISDELIIRVTASPGRGFIERMIANVEGKKRKKTVNEITITLLLVCLSLLFTLVLITLAAIAYYFKSPIDTPVFIALLVAFIPTTITGLLSTIGISGMDKAAQFNAIATSGKTIETCSDIDVLVLDKTGTITLGNRLAESFIPVNNHSLEELAHVCLAASIFDDTPEGKSIVRLAERLGAKVDFDRGGAQDIPFSPITRISGTNLPSGRQLRKGAVSAIKEFISNEGGQTTADLDAVFEHIAKQGGTPLAVAVDEEIFGVIYLRDIIKPGIRDRFERLRKMGVRTLMLTGDNNLTAAVIAREAGVENFIGDATPEVKNTVIRIEQAEGKRVAMTGNGANDASALAQANIGIAMNTGTQAAREVANIVDLDSDPTKLIDIIQIGQQLIMTRGALTIFTIANKIAEYFAVIPLLVPSAELERLNIINLTNLKSAILSILIYKALIIPVLIPFAFKGVKSKPLNVNRMVQRNILIYGISGIVVPMILIKIIDIAIVTVGLV